MMTERTTKIERVSSMTKQPVPMKLFAAWEVDRTPPNCIPRLCSLTITRLTLLTPFSSDLTSLSLAVKMQSSKRTLRSHEILVPQTAIATLLTPISTPVTANGSNSGGGGGSGSSGGVGGVMGAGTIGVGSGSGSVGVGIGGTGIASTAATAVGGMGSVNSPPVFLETDLDLHFSLQYPHFIKRDGNRLLILLQRRKKYKTRTILGYKTLAEGVIRMDGVLQKSMDMNVELMASGKSARSQGTPIATLRAERVSSIPVDHDLKNNNSVVLADRVNDYSDDDEEAEFSSNEENDEGNEIGAYNAKRNFPKRLVGNYRKLDRADNDGEDVAVQPGDSDSEFENLAKEKGNSTKISRRNFKQKIVALLKRFRVPEELDGAVARGTGHMHGERDLDALFQELETLSCGDDSGPEMDSLSVGSTPKPSLRPFFSNSRSMLHENLMGVKTAQTADCMDELQDIKNGSIYPDRSADWQIADSSGNEAALNETADTPTSIPPNTGSPPKDKEQTSIIGGSSGSGGGGGDKRNRFFRGTSTTPGGKKKNSLNLMAEPSRSLLETCLSPTNVEPRKSMLDQLSRIFSTDDTILPDVVALLGPSEFYFSSLSPKLGPHLAAAFRSTFSPRNTAEVKAILQSLMNKIQKYCNSTAKPPSTIKILLVGGDWLQGSVLQHYVELLSVRPPDWVNHFRFYIVPMGLCTISRYLSVIDQMYGALFGNDLWQQLCERAITVDAVQSKTDLVEITNRIQRYVHSAGPCTQIPIAEAMVNYKDEDPCQKFIPFVCDVKLGCMDSTHLSLDLDESLVGSLSNAQITSGSALLFSSSPPLGGRISPPQPPVPNTPTSSHLVEPLELQIDYWLVQKIFADAKEKAQTKGQDHGKNSLKSTFRSLKIWRLPNNPVVGEFSNGLTLGYATKEKKQKIMRLGKKKEKDKDTEKEQIVDGISRLICSGKQSHPIPMRVSIDGTEWTGVKFFQLSSQWQSHVKNFPVGLMGSLLSPLDN